MEKSKHPLKPISELVKPSKHQFNPKAHESKVFDYIEINDVDLLQGRILTSTKVSGKTAPNRARFILETGDFLIPNARDCIRGIAVVPKECKGWVCSNRFFVVKPKTELVDPTYLYHMLRQPEVLCLLKRYATGEINPGLGPKNTFWDEVKIPVPIDLENQRKIVEQILEREEEKKKLLAKLREYDSGFIHL